MFLKLKCYPYFPFNIGSFYIPLTYASQFSSNHLKFIIFTDFSSGIQRVLWFPRASHLHGALPGTEDVLPDSPVASFGLSTGRTILLRTQTWVRRSHSTTTTHNTAASHPSTHRHHDCWHKQVGGCKYRLSPPPPQTHTNSFSPPCNYQEDCQVNRMKWTAAAVTHFSHCEK